MKYSTQRKWFIKENNLNSQKKTQLSSPEKPITYNNLLFMTNLSSSNDLNTVCSSRANKKKTSQNPSNKQTRPPSAEIMTRHNNSSIANSNPLSLSSKLKSKPMIYNVTSPKIKVKSQNGPSATQKGFNSITLSKNPSIKSKNINCIEKDWNLNQDQSIKSTEFINESSSKSIHQLNETTLTIKAENPENSTKNIPLISPANNMMRRLTLNEKNNFFSTVTSFTNVASNETPILIKEENKKNEIDLEKKIAPVRSFSQNPKQISVPFNEIKNEMAHFKPIDRENPNIEKNSENPIQKISKLVSEINELETNGADYNLLKSRVLQLEEKITDLKCSIELKKVSDQKKEKLINNKENNNCKAVKNILNNLQQNSEENSNDLNNFVSAASHLMKNKNFSQKNKMPNFLNNKYLYPKSTTNADLNKKKFEFQSKPNSIKLQNIELYEELIPEESQIIVSNKHDDRILFDNISKSNLRRNFYYIENAVNSFYKSLNCYEDKCEDNYFTQLCQEHMLQTFNSLHLSKNIISNTENQLFEDKSFDLPELSNTEKNKKTLFFDLDETLVHCNESLELPADVILPIIFPNGQKIEAGINIRPFAKDCLKELSQYFEIIVFTASHSCYANAVLDYIDEKKEFIKHRMFREHCISTKEGLFIKDLRIIKNRNLKNMIIVDNAAYSFAFQIGNGIPILPFYDFKADKELLYLTEYLKTIADVEDIRESNDKIFRFTQYEKYEEIQQLFESELKRYILM